IVHPYGGTSRLGELSSGRNDGRVQKRSRIDKNSLPTLDNYALDLHIPSKVQVGASVFAPFLAALTSTLHDQSCFEAVEWPLYRVGTGEKLESRETPRHATPRYATPGQARPSRSSAAE
ncbi:hypothetical protein ALC56_11981, partial [Trachymyrmex septentrionalis]